MTHPKVAEFAAALERAARWNQTESEIAEYNSQAIDSKFAGIAERYKADAATLREIREAVERGERTLIPRIDGVVGWRECLVLPLQPESGNDRNIEAAKASGLPDGGICT